MLACAAFDKRAVRDAIAKRPDIDSFKKQRPNLATE